MRFWVDEVPLNPEDSRSRGDEKHHNPYTSARDVSRAPVTPEGRERGSPTQEVLDRDRNRGSPDFGGGTGYCENDGYQRGPIPEGENSAYQGEHIPENDCSLI